MRTRTLIGAGVAAALAGAILSYQAPVWAHGWGPMGYGPGYHMRSGGEPGWNCPGVGGAGYGPGMMGYGYGPRAGAQGPLNLTTDDVKNRMERWLEWRGNPRLKLGDVKEKNADTITADIVTKDNSLVDRFIVDRHTGRIRRDTD